MVLIETAVQEVKNGNSQQFEVVIEKFQQQLFHYCYHMLGNTHEAEDAVQESFLKAFEKIASYKASISFSAWLYKIAYNHCMNILRRKKLLSFVPFMENVSTGSDHFQSALEAKGYSRDFIKVLDKISPADKSILTLRILEEKSYEEIGHILDMKPGTIRKKYERLRKKLKQLLTQKEGGLLHEKYSLNG